MADLLRVNPTQILDSNGDPVAGAKLTFYLTGTTTPVTVYTDNGLTTPHDSPVVADGDGYVAEIFYGGASAVKCVITDADDVEIATLDPVAKAPTSTAGATNVSFAPVTGNSSTNVQAAIAANTARLEDFGTQSVAGKAIFTASTPAAQRTAMGVASSDGDHLDITFTPTNYTPDTTPDEADDVDDLAAHLAGIDAKFGAVYTSTAQTITAAGSLTLAHGLDGTPMRVDCWLQCVTAEEGYSIGDKLIVPPSLNTNTSSSSRGLSVVPDGTNLNIRYGAAAETFVALHKTTGATVALTNSRWNLFVQARV